MPQTERTEAAERALKERARLYAAYRRAKARHRRTLYQQEPRLKAFTLQLNRFGPDDAGWFLGYVRGQNQEWLCTAPPEIRAEALSLVNERVQRIRQNLGLLPLSDPLPDQDDDVWQSAKRELA